MAKTKNSQIASEIKNSDAPLTRDEQLMTVLICAYISKGCGNEQALKEAKRMLPLVKEELWPALKSEA